ncbi:hypothetical protein [Chitinophaga japonensis]|uniref:Uncharacterized protein n=1 Tax=Chitinophaga japonensis TaxID=104662 RepID=A0A562SYQ2_CHIJA|nr:hypothetical protein [Chitinophaga japonensis]TWI86421.1 hypothetical protein LX66_3678 [Chitinophaga japonensis]
MHSNHHASLLLALLLAAACQSGQRPDTSAQTVDSLIPDTIASVPPDVSMADPYVTQLEGQDTVFEDGTVPSSWADAGFDDPAGFKHFLLRFKEWVRTDNVDSVAAYIDFPIRGYQTAAQFKGQYATVFDEQMKEMVARQRLDRVFRNYQGAMLGEGQLWFADQEGKGYRIIAINKE